VFGLSVQPGNGVFLGFSGTLDAAGAASAAFAVPPLPVLAGLPLYFSGLTVQSPSPPVERSTLPWVRTVVR
jgi:hypothetical protein